MNFRKFNLFYIAIILAAIGLIYFFCRRSVIEGADATTGAPNETTGAPNATTGAPDATTGAPDATTGAPDATAAAASGPVTGPTTSSGLLSDALDSTAGIKYASIDQQINEATNIIGKIYGKIPVSISDIKPGSISTIPYDAAIKSGVTHVKINVIPKLDKLRNPVYYSINSSGPATIYDSSTLTSKLNPLGATMISTNTDIPGSPPSSSYSIVFPACQWIIDMRLPMGPKGDQGDKGPVGDVGPPGAVGAKGQYGFIGNWGKPY